MSTRRGDTEEGGQPGAAAQDRVHAEATQEGAGVVGRGMPVGGIRVVATPGQDGGTVHDEVAQAHDPPCDGLAHGGDEQQFVHRGAGLPCPQALCCRTGHAGAPLRIQRQTTRQGQRRPRVQPGAHVGVGEPPQHPQQRDEQQTFGCLK